MKTKDTFRNIDVKKDKGILFDILLLIAFVGAGTTGRTLLVGWNFQPFPNFEIIMVITFLAAIFLRSTMVILVPLLSMIFSDLLLGNSIFVGNQMNRIVLFTYSGFAIIALVTIFNRNKFGKNLGEFLQLGGTEIGGMGSLGATNTWYKLIATHATPLILKSEDSDEARWLIADDLSGLDKMIFSASCYIENRN